jgi:hypothetical protein
MTPTPTSKPTASERLAQSRERLRQAMQDVMSPPKANKHRPSENSAAFDADWLTKLKAIPGADLLLGLLQDWWAKQPMHVAMTQVAEAVKAALRPISRRHPYAMVFGAAAVGALLVVARPWRWISKPALLASLLPALIAAAMKLMPDQAQATPAQTPHTDGGQT